MTEYGRQKADAENRLKQLGKKIVIVRLTKVLSSHQSLIENWRSVLLQNQVSRPFSDLVVSPVTLDLVTDVLSRLPHSKTQGIVQISGPEDMTYETLARRLAEQIGASQNLIEPTTSQKADVYVEALPPYSTLDTSSLNKISGLIVMDARFSPLDE